MKIYLIKKQNILHVEIIGLLYKWWKYIKSKPKNYSFYKIPQRLIKLAAGVLSAPWLKTINNSIPKIVFPNKDTLPQCLFLIKNRQKNCFKLQIVLNLVGLLKTN